MNKKLNQPSKRLELIEVPEDAGLVAKYGPPATLGEKGQPSTINQMFIAAKYARDHLVLHEPALNQFFAYHSDTGLWKAQTEASLTVEVGNALPRMLLKCGAGSLIHKRTENFLGQILKFLKGITERPDAFRSSQKIIHVANGVLRLDTDPPSSTAFNPDYYSRNRSEVCYDPAATCPRFLSELLEQALDADDISLLQRYGGQCLLGRNLSQTILLLRGTPGGGKSTLANILEDIIGTHNVTQLRIKHLGERFEIAGYVGKTLLSGKDVPGSFLSAPSVQVLKSLVGGDRLDAEEKNVRHRFEVRGEFNVIITSNTRLNLRLDADSGAWRRRLLIVDYERPSVIKPVPDFSRWLIANEGPGILNWCIEGALLLLAELKAHGRIQLTERQMKRVDDLLCESDSVRHFVTERIVKCQEGNLTVAELHTAYLEFCAEQDWQAVTQRQFEHQIGDIMMEVFRAARRTDIKRNEKNQRGFFHVGFKEDSRQ